MRRKLELDGSIFQSTSDTEVIVHLMARGREPDIESRITNALRHVDGAYSLVFLSESKLIAVRDPHGFRPLVLGRLKDAFVFASETCAFDLLEAEFIREVEPGEMIVVDAKGLRAFKPVRTEESRRFCVFEHVYFARPDSHIDGRSVYRVARALGRALAKEHPGRGRRRHPRARLGNGRRHRLRARRAASRSSMGLIRSHYVGRTFIEPQQSIRHFGVQA